MKTHSINSRCTCFNLRRVTRAVTQFYDRALEPAGIRATQFTLLVSLSKAELYTLTEMANSLVMDRTTLTRNLKPLEKLDLIEIKIPKDRRSKAYGLTPKGREILDKGIPLWEKAQNQVEERFGASRYRHLLTELEAVVQVVGQA
jgi:DNA-binding MarR family transcriptional regulator